MELKNKKTVIEQTYRESGSGNKELRDTDRLVELFEILMRIDRRQKKNEKNN